MSQLPDRSIVVRHSDVVSTAKSRQPIPASLVALIPALLLVVFVALSISPAAAQAHPLAITLSTGPVVVTPVLTLTGETNNNLFGYSVAPAGDVNGDGFADVIVGENGYNSGSGRAYVYYGSASGLSGTPALTLTGQSGDNFGSSVSTAGDVNDDGYDDVIIGAASSPGRAYVYHGSASGLSATPALTLTGEASGDSFGWSVATAGDVNHDGYADVIVGAWGYSSLTGRAYVYHGSASGLSATPALTLTGRGILDEFGWSVATAGDVNHDGYDDVIVSEVGYNSNTGRAYVYHGSVSGLNATPALTLTGASAGINFGQSVATAGDVNGDNYADVIIGANEYGGTTGQAYVYQGSVSGLNTTPALTLTGHSGDDFGWSVSTAGDMNDDGYADVIIGADIYGGNTGRAYIYQGSLGGLSATPVLTLTGENIGNFFGSSVATAGDVNGDGYADAIVGAYAYNSNQGRAYLYLGTACTQVLNTNDSGANSLRAAIACAQPGDTITFGSGLANQTITLTTTEIVVTQTNIIIDGSNAPNVSVSGNNAMRIFTSTATIGTLTVQNITLTQGVAMTSTGSNGGALYVRGALMLSNTTLINNSATGQGGGAYAVGAATLNGGLFQNNTSTGLGGGLSTDSTLTLSDTRFLSNTAYFGGGGASAVSATTLNGGLFQNNTSLGSSGGGLYAISTLALTDTQFLSNTAKATGSGAYAGGAVTLNGGLFENNTSSIDGGGLYVNNTLVLTGTQFLSNTAQGAGGGMAVASAAILNNGLFQNNIGNNSGGGLYTIGPLALTGTQFISNSSGLNGGGVRVFGATTLNGGLFQNNTALGFGGGLAAESTLALTGTQFISNTASGVGGGAIVQGAVTLNGGLFQNNRSTTGLGGGLFAGNTLALTGTQFLSNTSTLAGGGAVALGAATLNGGLFQNNTSTNNQGGGLYANNTLALTDTQFLSNTASGFGGGAYSIGAVTLNGGLFQNNTSTNNQGGGLYAATALVLTGTQFLSNTAYLDGGGVRSGGVTTLKGGLFQNNQSTLGTGGGLWAFFTLTLTDTQFLSNTAAGSGGGVYLVTGNNSRLINNLFRYNHSDDEGGALFIKDSPAVTVTANKILNNYAAHGGGGAYVTGPSTQSSVQLENNFIGGNTVGAGAVDLDLGGPFGSIINGAHNTFVANTIGNGTALAAGMDTSGDVISLTNSIFDGYDLAAQTGSFAATINLEGVLWYSVTNQTSGSGISISNDITGTPDFVDRPNGDYHIGADSAAIDRGVAASTTTDIDGHSRPQGLAKDLGADEVLQYCNSLSTNTDYPLLSTPPVTVSFSATGNIACLAAVYIPRAHDHATGTFGHGVGADHFWDIVALDGSGATATGFIATITVPYSSLVTPVLCFYPGSLGGYDWDCDSTQSHTGSTVTRSGLTHFSDWSVGTAGPTAITLESISARNDFNPIGWLLLIGAIGSLIMFVMWKRRALKT